VADPFHVTKPPTPSSTMPQAGQNETLVIEDGSPIRSIGAASVDKAKERLDDKGPRS